MGKINREEIWKDIPKYEGRYQVSNTGRVKSLVCHAHQNPILSPHLRSGYKEVGLTDATGRRTGVSVHRLVVAAFYGEIPSGMFVNHIDGTRTNNNVENLEIVTPAENVKHAYRIGLAKPSDNGFKKKIAIIKDDKVERVFDSIRGMCREMGFDRRAVRRSMLGVYGPCYGYKFVEI